MLVGDTAAALHAGHRFSLDGDHVTPELRDQFDQVLSRLEALAGWNTNRVKPPVMILGRFQGVETGIRQLIRTAPLETARALRAVLAHRYMYGTTVIWQRFLDRLKARR